MKVFVVILATACVALAGMLAFNRTRVQARLITTQNELAIATNQMAETAVKLTEQEKLSGFLQQHLDQRSMDLVATSNDLVKAGTTLASVQNDLQAAMTAAKIAQADAQTKSVRITQLETEKDDMSKKLGELAGQINTLEDNITETKRKLAAAEGDRSYLTKELARLQTDKADLVRQFNDLAVLQAQVAMLKEEAAINQRIAWTAQGVYTAAGRKGAEALVSRPAQTTRPDPSLNVEVEQTGDSRVVPTTKAPQNP